MQVWRLSSDKTLAAIENGHDIDELREFLQANDDQPLPETVESFIATSKKQGRALKVAGVVLLIECSDEKTARALAAHECTKNLCQLAGTKDLLVHVERENEFRKALKIIGYGMPPQR